MASSRVGTYERLRSAHAGPELAVVRGSAALGGGSALPLFGFVYVIWTGVASAREQARTRFPAPPASPTPSPGWRSERYVNFHCCFDDHEVDSPDEQSRGRSRR